MTDKQKESTIKHYSILPMDYLNDLRNDTTSKIKELQDRIDAINTAIDKRKTIEGDY